MLQGDGRIFVKIANGVAKYLAVSEDADKPITEWTTITQTGTDDLVQVTVGSTDNPATETDETRNTEFSIGNTPGTALPQTGGHGTTLFTAIGGFMTATAGAVLALASRRRKRKSAEG